MATIKLGEMLLKAKILKEGQLRLALNEQQKQGGRLGEILVKLSLVTEDLLVRALSRQMGLPVTDLDMVQELAQELQAKLPRSVAASYEAVPIRLGDGGKLLTVAMADPQNTQMLERLKSITGCRISPHIASRSSIGRALRRLYDPAGEMELPEEEESSFRVLDAQGMMREARETLHGRGHAQPTEPDVKRPKAPPTISSSPAAPTQPHEADAPAHIPSARLRASGPRTKTPTTVPVPASADPMELVRSLEATQRKEVAALKAMVELLIERRVFSREEYLAKLKR